MSIMGLFFPGSEELKAELASLDFSKRLAVKELESKIEQLKKELEDAKYILPDFRISFNGKVWVVEELEGISQLYAYPRPSEYIKQYKEIGTHKTKEAAEKAIADKAAGYSYYTRSGEQV